MSGVFIAQKSAIDKTEADYFYGMVSSWKPRREVWPFIYGDDCLAMAATATAFYACYYFRRKVQLAHIARLSVHFPTVATASVTSLAFQGMYITPEVLTYVRCPLCVQIKSAMVQFVTGMMIPVAIASIGAFHYADKALTYAIPSILEAPKEVAQLWWKFAKPNGRVFLAYGMLNMIAAVAITAKKQRCLAEIEDKIFRK